MQSANILMKSKQAYVSYVCMHSRNFCKILTKFKEYLS